MVEAALPLRLEYLLTLRDEEIALLKRQIVETQLRRVLGASDAATFDPQGLSFIEPPSPYPTPDSPDGAPA